MTDLKFLKNVNKQVKRTRDWIFGALLSLLDEKKYEDIKIANITEKAGVARQSFYRNYEGKDDIVSKFIETLFAEYGERLDTRFESETFDSGEIYRLFFDVLYEHRDDLLKIKDASLSHLLYSSFRQYSNALIKDFFDENHVQKSDDETFFIQYQLGGIIALTVDWICRNMAESPAELSKKLNAVTAPFADSPYFLPSLIKTIYGNTVHTRKAETPS